MNKKYYKILFVVFLFFYNFSFFCFADNLIIPEIKINFQNPSYLIDKNQILDSYHCDKEKTECKVNFDLRQTFSGSQINNFSCKNDFSFITGEEEKCNPNTIIFGTGSYDVKFKIYEKNNLDNFREKVIKIVNETGNSETNSDGQTGTGTNTNSGNLDNSQTGSIEIPDVEIEIQSGLEKKEEKYFCKNSNCKINLNLEKVFTGVYESKNYECEWNFGSGSFEITDTDKKCNPGYVKFGTGTHEIIAEIYEKDNKENSKTGNLIFTNLNSDGQTGTGTNSNSGNLDNSQTGDISFPKIKIDFQSPSYLLSKDLEKSEYNCDSSKYECKVNFDLRKSFIGFKESDFFCKIDFGFDSGEENKCNPNTVIFPEGENKIVFNIYKKVDSVLVGKKELIIRNIKKSFQNNGNLSISSEKSRNIIMQSGAKKSGENSYFCNKEVCKINLKFDKKTGEICKWYFGKAEFKEKYLETCNPGFIYFRAGEFKISLKVEKDGNLENYNIFLKNNFLENREELSFQSKIVVQGRLSKDKELSENKLICNNLKLCSVNFTSKINKNLDSKSLNFFWDFGNGETFYGQNPKSIKYLPGKYEIVLKISDNYGKIEEKYFFVEVYENKKEEVLDFVNLDLINYLKIKNVYPNPRKSQEEYLTLKNNFFLPINLKGLEIDDKIFSGSKSFNIKNDYYLLPFQSKKFYKNQTKINLNNSFDELNLIYDKKIIDKIKWDFKTEKAMILSHNNSLNYDYNILDFIKDYREDLSKNYEKKVIKDFDKVFRELLEEEKNNLKKKTEKIITYKTSKLKSSLKFSGKTFPNSQIILNFMNQYYKTKSLKNGEYKFWIKNNLKPGEYYLNFKVLKNGKIYNYKSSRKLKITQKYINELNSYKLKKSKKKKKVSKKSTKDKVKTKKIRFEIKSLKTDDSSSEKENKPTIIFLATILSSSLGFLSFRKLF